MVHGRAGDFAYIDGFAGLVPCKVLTIDGASLVVRITATRGAYKRGEVSTHSAHFVTPRSAIVFRNRQARIRPYKWVGTPPGVHSPDHQAVNID